jgi:hypothetical protein
LEAMSSQVDPEVWKLMKSYLQDDYSDSYEYERLSNGFALTVTGPRSNFIKWDTVRRKYLPGDARQSYNVTITVVTNR